MHQACKYWGVSITDYPEALPQHTAMLDGQLWFLEFHSALHPVRDPLVVPWGGGEISADNRCIVG
jgi:hypothetical protein